MPDPRNSSNALWWTALLMASGAISLGYEVLWIRRLSLVLGGSTVAGAVVISAFMGGLAIGAWLSNRLPNDRRGPQVYAGLEAFAAAWALALPAMLATAAGPVSAWRAGPWLLALAVLLPPATALGATWPLLARAAGPSLASGLYAANTTGAVLGVLATTFIALPALGVRSSEWLLAAAGIGVAIVASRLSNVPRGETAQATVVAPLAILAASAAAGFASLGLEVVWFRLAAVGMGATVQTMGWVLAVFLATVAIGAWIGRHWPRDPWAGLGGALAALAALALLGAAGWGQLPYVVAGLYRWGGPEAMLPGSALIAAIAMGGAPIASGMAFSLAVRALGPALRDQAGSLYAANTAGSIVGSAVTGLLLVPLLEVRGAVLFLAGTAAVAAVAVRRPLWPILPALGLLAAALPSWDARLYAVGVHLRISDFQDPSAASIAAFADEGWELLHYDHGLTGAVAVGRGARTGNLWLSINGKVDASTGDDMPTQILSGSLPLGAARDAAEVLVVGLASGITAGTVLQHPGVERMTVLELEPAVVPASRYFDAFSGAPLDDPRTTLRIQDARAFLQRPGPSYDVIISEPSNPWITGVSSLFTLEYWRAGRARLREGGVFCQWVQLYGMGPEEFRGIVRTFATVFPDTWLFETIEGSDVLLLGGVGALPETLDLAPTLDPAGVRRLGGAGWLNTDDQPRVEWAAPHWLHYQTGPDNARLIEQATRPDEAPGPSSDLRR